MLRNLFFAVTFSIVALHVQSQQTIKKTQDSTERKGGHQIKTVNSKVIKLDKPQHQNNKSLPPMMTRQDTLLYLIQQHKQSKNNTQ
ncbi:MAG: hypothetical protein JNL47_06455 [Bacteroidia bacterium]|nr:hypothetical protein [Bacteroidia bacterium]